MREERRNAYVVGEDPNPVQLRKYLSNIYPPSLLLIQVSHAQYRGLVGWLLVPGLGLFPEKPLSGLDYQEPPTAYPPSET